MVTVTRELDIKNVVEKIKKHPKVAAIILFGSYAKNKAGPMSDIDIAVIIKNPDKKTEAEIGSMYSDILDISLFHKVPLYMQYEILKTGKPLYIKNKKYFQEIKMKTLRAYHEMEHIYEKIRKRVLK